MSQDHPGFRIFIIGAGFSIPAGLPLAYELYSEVRRRIERLYGRETKFHRDLNQYIEYRKSCDRITLSADEIDLEELMSFLDLEHFLGLRGSKTWSSEGNESQLMVKQHLGQVIHERTPPADQLPPAYYEFASRLTTRDIVFTFNYDILLERALDYVGIPYRLFPDRYKSTGHLYSEVDDDTEELIVLKLHGSVDWFDDRHFLELSSSLQEQGLDPMPIHSVFDNPEMYGVQPLVDGPIDADDPLLHIHRIQDADSYYSEIRSLETPFILSPSHVKFVYAEPLLDFWHGMGRYGGYNLGISVIGFSLPEHDDYIRIGLYQMISNYQSWWDTPLLGVLKDNIRMVDLRHGKTEVEEYKKRFSFADTIKTEYFLEGFSSDAIDFLFSHPRTA